MQFSAPVKSAHALLVEQQLAAIRCRHDVQCRPHAPRSYGVGVDFQALLTDAGVSDLEQAECKSLRLQDPRFAFLDGLSSSMVVAVAVGNALEESLFGGQSTQVSRIVASIQAFIRLLDGLIDEAPDIVASEKQDLLRLLHSAWTIPEAPAALNTPREQHIALVLLNRIASQWVRQVRATPIWQADRRTRQMFSVAVQHAMQAEYRSTAYTIGGAAAPLHAMRQAFRAKSTKVSWVVAMVPILVHGWPQGLDKRRYRRSTDLFGIYVGWIDDIYDLLDDLEQRRWSNALLELYRFAGCPAYDTHQQAVESLAVLLEDPTIRRSLLEKGVGYHVAFFDSLFQIGVDAEPIRRLIANAV